MKESHRSEGPQTDFGPAYFRKFYLSTATRVVTPAEMNVRVRVIVAVLAQASVPVRSILDVGCGIGLMRKPFARALPRARYSGIDVSDYLCERYGWLQASVVDFVPRKPSDLVICYDVLQYLADKDAARAIVNLGRLSRAGLYVSALTREDWRDNCDRSLTDRAVHLRPGEWYRNRLKRHFRYVGMGVWLKKEVTALLWDMERAAP